VMKRNPEMEHADENMVTVAPGKTGEIVWQFTKAGKIDATIETCSTRTAAPAVRRGLGCVVTQPASPMSAGRPSVVLPLGGQQLLRMRGVPASRRIGSMAAPARMTTLLIAALVAAGCGGGSQAPSDADLVASTIKDYLRLQADGDAVQACTLLTASGRRQLTAFVAERARSMPLATGSLTCERAIELVRLVAGTELLDAMRNAEVENVHVTGPRANAEVVGTGDVGRRPVSLQKTGDVWRIRAVLSLGG